MNVDARARASGQAIDRSATRVNPFAALDDLLRRRRRQPLLRAAAIAVALLVMVVAVWAGGVWLGPTPVRPTLGPVTRIGVGVGARPVSVALSPGAAWVLNDGNATVSRVDPSTGRVQASFPVARAEAGYLVFVAVGEGRLWVVHARGAPDPTVSVIDLASNRTLTTFGLSGSVLEDQAQPGDITVGAGAV